MSFRIDKEHPFTVCDVVRVTTITNIAEETAPGGPTWWVRNVFWENGEPYCEVVQMGDSERRGITRRVTARRCRLVSAVDRLGDVARE